jgi:molecular chaperone DnaK
MRKDAESHAAEDKAKRELVEARNRADSMCYEIEKTMKAQGDKLSGADKQSLEGAIAKVRDAAKGDDAGRIKTAVGELEAAAHAMSAALYQQASAAPGATGPSDNGATDGSGKAADDDTIDAEFEVKS